MADKHEELRLAIVNAKTLEETQAAIDAHNAHAASQLGYYPNGQHPVSQNSGYPSVVKLEPTVGELDAAALEAKSETVVDTPVVDAAPAEVAKDAANEKEAHA